MRRAPAQALEDKIVELGADQVIAFVAETVVGATAGAVPPVADYFKRIRAICDRYGVLLILDEVMCGMGRTGTLHACEQDGIAPDLMTIAKGLGGGYQPIGAVLLSEQDLRGVRQGFRRSSSTATPIWAIRWPPPPGSRYRRSFAATDLLGNVAAHGRSSAAPAGRALRQPSIMSATSAAAACSAASNWSPTATPRSRSIPN